MARLPRFVLPDQPQHIIQRGNNRQDIFIKSDDYQFYLEKLTDAAQKHQCDIHAYVLMTNHVRLVVTSHTEDGIGKMMQMLGKTIELRQSACRQLFREKIPESVLVSIRESTNKAWVLGSDRFKKE